MDPELICQPVLKYLKDLRKLHQKWIFTSFIVQYTVNGEKNCQMSRYGNFCMHKSLSPAGCCNASTITHNILQPAMNFYNVKYFIEFHNHYSVASHVVISVAIDRTDYDISKPQRQHLCTELKNKCELDIPFGLKIPVVIYVEDKYIP